MIKNDGESETHSIVFGQTCKLRAWDWSSVVADVTLSPKTFGFASDLAATPVICLNISDLEDRPVHVPSKHCQEYHLRFQTNHEFKSLWVIISPLVAALPSVPSPTLPSGSSAGSRRPR